MSKPNIPKAQSQTTHIQVSCRSGNMTVQYNTVPAEHQPLVVAEAPKKRTGRVVAAVAAALILGTAVTATTPVFRAGANLATYEKTAQIMLDTSEAGQWAPKQPMCISVEDRGKTVPVTYWARRVSLSPNRYLIWSARICTARRPRSRSA